MSKGFIYNLNKCVGCNACVVACSIENNTDISNNYRKVNTFNNLQFSGLPLYHLSLACNHCDDAPCVAGCPSTALQKNQETGIVTIDDKLCIGCKYCTWTCPYDAPKFNIHSKVIEKCNLCESTVLNGGIPACANLCPTGALSYGEIQESNLETASFPHKNTQPRVEIIPSRKEKGSTQITEMDPEARAAIHEELKKETKSHFSFQSEWSLITFTSLVAILFGWFAAKIIALPSTIYQHFSSIEESSIDFMDLEPIIFIILGAVAGFISFLHLGKKFRALNALRNLRGSWLSREIFFYAVFFILSSYFLLIRKTELLGTLGILSGLLMLFSIDKVYSFSVRKYLIPVHSAHVLLTGIFFTSFFLERMEVFYALLALKLILYFSRKINFHLKGESRRRSLALPRILFGFIIPLSILFVGKDLSYANLLILISIIIGEYLDRIEFYLELKVLSPKSQILDQLKKLTS